MPESSSEITLPPRKPKFPIKLALSSFFLFALLSVSVAGVKIRQTVTSSAYVPILASVRINPEIITLPTSSLGTPVYLSALAYDSSILAIHTGVNYEWGLSSTSNSIGGLKITGEKTATFIPTSAGTGDLWVMAIQGNEMVKKSIRISIGECEPGQPQFSIAPGEQSVPLGINATFTYSITNNDSQYCPAAIINNFGSHNLPAGWRVNFSPSYLTLFPGQTATVQAVFNSGPTSPYGQFRLYFDPLSSNPEYNYPKIGTSVLLNITPPSPTLDPTLPPESTPDPTAPVPPTATPTSEVIPSPTPIPEPTPTAQPNNPPVIPTNSLPTGRKYRMYYALIRVADPDRGDRLSLKISGLNRGLYSRCSSNWNTGQCTIIGFPFQSSTQTVTVTANDKVNPLVSKSFTLTVK